MIELCVPSIVAAAFESAGFLALPRQYSSFAQTHANRCDCQLPDQAGGVCQLATERYRASRALQARPQVSKIGPLIDFPILIGLHKLATVALAKLIHEPMCIPEEGP